MLLAALSTFFGRNIFDLIKCIAHIKKKSTRTIAIIGVIASVVIIVSGACVIAAHDTASKLKKSSSAEPESNTDTESITIQEVGSIPELTRNLKPEPMPPDYTEVYFAIPPIIVMLDPEDVCGDTFLNADEVDDKFRRNINSLDRNTLIVELDRLAISLPEGEMNKLYHSFQQTRGLGDREGEALSLSDTITLYADSNRANLDQDKYAYFRFLAAGLSLYSLSGADDLETSPLAYKAWNRVWTTLEYIAMIPGIPETERSIFYSLAASGAYIRISKSYDGECDVEKRAKDIMCCRVLYIRLMDIAKGQNPGAALSFALRGKVLTDLAIVEGLVLPGNADMRDDETCRIDEFLVSYT